MVTHEANLLYVCVGVYVCVRRTPSENVDFSFHSADHSVTTTRMTSEQREYLIEKCAGKGSVVVECMYDVSLSGWKVLRVSPPHFEL